MSNMVVHTCNSSPWEGQALGVGNFELEVSIGNTVSVRSS